MYFYKENKMGAKIFKKKNVGPILMFAHLTHPPKGVRVQNFTENHPVFIFFSLKSLGKNNWLNF